MTGKIFRSLCLVALTVFFVMAGMVGAGLAQHYPEEQTALMMEPLLLAGLAVLAILFILAAVLARDVVQPLNRLDLDRPLKNTGYPELLPLLQRISSQQTQLQLHENVLRRKQEEFRAATDNLNEGLLLLNEQGLILSANKTARKLLQLPEGALGRRLTALRPDLGLMDLVAQARAGLHAEGRLQLGGGEYQINASPVDSGEVLCGIALLLFDVTEQERAEQMRREFTANVSHELKTPLHTISGSAELMKNGMIRQEDIPRFAGHIYEEAQRLITLVEDIIRLSRMDEGAVGLQKEPVDLLDLARQALNSLAPASAAAGIVVRLEGEGVTVTGVRQLLEGLIFNLCDNGIKYNRPGGSLTVTVSRTGGLPAVRVEDTGIGIPAEHRERIFERFYRVDKSHSKEVGGTGLGLSIVKHAAKLHGAQLQLESTEGQGTAITVIFPSQS